MILIVDKNNPRIKLLAPAGTVSTQQTGVITTMGAQDCVSSSTGQERY